MPIPEPTFISTAVYCPSTADKIEDAVLDKLAMLMDSKIQMIIILCVRTLYICVGKLVTYEAQGSQHSGRS